MVMHPVECVAMLLQSLLPIYMFPTHIGNNDFSAIVMVKNRVNVLVLYSNKN